MKINLCEYPWQFKGYWEWDPIKGSSMETGIELQGIMDWADATVPGGVQFDLYHHGMIDDPLYAQNCLKCEWVENRWWMYKTEFPAPVNPRRVDLLCMGLDYECDIYLNGKKIGSHAGMYAPKVIEITSLLREKNTLCLLFRGVPRETGQIGFTSNTFTQKARFNYKWDFSTRMVNIGPWQEVLLHVYDDAELLDPFTGSTLRGGGNTPIVGEVSFEAFLHAADGQYDADVTLYAPDGELAAHCELFGLRSGEKLRATLHCPDPQLWWPNGAGEQPLYTLKIELNQDGHIAGGYSHKLGIRSLAYAQNEGAADALPYTFVVNGRKLYIKGVNMTPLDMMYGNVGREQYRHMVLAMARLNVNMVRIWGGGIIETEAFYDECDRLGIMVWQEFIQSSSGIDNKPSERPEFLELLWENARAALLGRRSHTSLTVWSGGNELMELDGTPCGYDNKNIAMLKALCDEYDPGRLFLPTSASGPSEFITAEKGKNHDVHGDWQYKGNPKHYEVYGQTDSLFHSEFGTDGAACSHSLQKFLPAESLRPTTMTGDRNWWYHGAWWGTYNRDISLFGEITELSLFCGVSQYMQQEGLRYIVEANRRRKFQNSGSIVWQLNEPWPNASCTDLIDYYGQTKMAYYALQEAYAPRHASLSYQRLDTTPGESFASSVWLSNSTDAFDAALCALVRSADGTVIYSQEYGAQIPENRSVQVGSLSFPVPDCPVFFVTLRFDGRNNTYVFSTLTEAILSPLKELTPVLTLQILSKTSDGDGTLVTINVKNTGNSAALGVTASTDCDGWIALADRGNLTLFPGEEALMEVLMLPRTNYGSFLSRYNDSGEKPVPVLRHLADC